MQSPDDYAWNMLVELRKEIISSQHLKNQTINFKVTLIATAVGIVVAQELPAGLLVIPALAAVFFDLIIDSHVATIRRIGLFTRDQLEPVIRASVKWPSDRSMWEEMMAQPRSTVARSLVGNVGLTVIVCAVAFIAMVQNWETWPTLPLACLLVAALLLDVAVVFFGGPHWPRRLETAA